MTNYIEMFNFRWRSFRGRKFGRKFAIGATHTDHHDAIWRRPGPSATEAQVATQSHFVHQRTDRKFGERWLFSSFFFLFSTPATCVEFTWRLTHLPLLHVKKGTREGGGDAHIDHFSLQSVNESMMMRRIRANSLSGRFRPRETGRQNRTARSSDTGSSSFLSNFTFGLIKSSSETFEFRFGSVTAEPNGGVRRSWGINAADPNRNNSNNSSHLSRASNSSNNNLHHNNSNRLKVIRSSNCIRNRPVLRATSTATTPTGCTRLWPLQWWTIRTGNSSSHTQYANHVDDS